MSARDSGGIQQLSRDDNTRFDFCQFIKECKCLQQTAEYRAELETVHSKSYPYLMILLAAGIAVFTSCKSGVHCDTPSAGNANLSRVIAVGNSFTAGYMDGGLCRNGQLNSYPSIIGQQMQKVGEDASANLKLFFTGFSIQANFLNFL